MILIKIEKNNRLFIKKCLKMGINLYGISYHKDYLTCKIDISDYENIKEKCYFSDITIIKYLGKKGMLIHLTKYIYDYCLLILLIIGLFFVSNVIVEVKVKHENKTLKTDIYEILLSKKIKPYTFALSIKNLNKISDEIVKNNNDKLEWLSIYRTGMKYVVSFEERITKNVQEEDKYCHIVASKPAVIKKVITYNGENVVERDKFVNKGDILITGTIKKDEEIKKNTCANGIVLAESWYKVNVTYPLKYTEKKYTKRKRINFKYNNNYFYKKHYKSYEEKRTFKFGPFSIVREFETKEETLKYNVIDAKNKAMDAVTNELKKKISSNSEIIDKKVLKENEFDSKIELEVFVSVIEDIGKKEYFTIENTVGDESDTN